MKNLGLMCSLVAVLAGCSKNPPYGLQNQSKLEQRYQEGFITATLAVIDGVPTAIGVFEDGTTNSTACIKSTTTESVMHLLKEDTNEKNVDLCFFPNARLVSINNFVPAS